MGTWQKVPTPQLVYESEDEAALPDQLGASLIDGFIDELNVLHSRPGLSTWKDLGTGAPLEGLFWWDDQSKIISVSNGKTFKHTSSDGSFTEISGDLLNSGQLVSFAVQDNNLVMASGGRMVTSTSAATTAFIADPDAPIDVDFVAYIDQIIIATSGRQRAFFADTADVLSWNALSFVSAEAKFDALKAMQVSFREIYFFGGRTTEVWRTDGRTPLVRIDNAFNEMGIIAKDSLVNARGTYLWLNNDKQVARMDGGRNISIVSPPVDDSLFRTTPVTDARAFYLPFGNGGFYILSFPTADKTFVYDLARNKWMRWGRWNTATGVYNRYKGQVHAYSPTWDLCLVGDKDTGIIWKVDPDVFTDGGDVIRTLYRTGHISFGTLREKRFNKLRIRMKMGTGDAVALNNPVVSIRWKINNRNNFGTEVIIPLGKVGQTEWMADINRLGTFETVQFEIVHATNAKFTLVEMEANLDVQG